MKYRGYAKKTDHNQKGIIHDLERIGAEVEPLSGREGMPDLLVTLAGRLFLLEVKNPKGKNKVSKGQEDFHKRFPMTKVVRSSEEALEIVTKGAV